MLITEHCYPASNLSLGPLAPLNTQWCLNGEPSELQPYLDEPFRGCSRHTQPTMMKLSTVILYLKKIQKKYISRDMPLEFC